LLFSPHLFLTYLSTTDRPFNFAITFFSGSSSRADPLDSDSKNFAPPCPQSDFARGWRKLPNELKLQVLVHNLITVDGFEYALAQHGDLENMHATLNATLTAHMCMGPEIAPLALQVYTEQNTFVIHMEPHTTSPPFLGDTLPLLPHFSTGH
jgi:hypothetical protein